MMVESKFNMAAYAFFIALLIMQVVSTGCNTAAVSSKGETTEFRSMHNSDHRIVVSTDEESKKECYYDWLLELMPTELPVTRSSVLRCGYYVAHQDTLGDIMYFDYLSHNINCAYIRLLNDDFPGQGVTVLVKFAIDEKARSFRPLNLVAYPRTDLVGGCNLISIRKEYASLLRQEKNVNITQTYEHEEAVRLLCYRIVLALLNGCVECQSYFYNIANDFSLFKSSPDRALVYNEYKLFLIVSGKLRN